MRIVAVGILIIIFLNQVFTPKTILASTAAEIDRQIQQLQRQLKANQSKIDDLDRKAEIYAANIKIKQGQAVTLKNQIEIINDQIAKTQTEIQSLNLKLDDLNTQISQVENIAAKLTADTLKAQAESVAIIRELQLANSSNLFLLFWANRDWSEVLTQNQRRLQLNQELTKKIISLRENQDAYNRLEQYLNSQKADVVAIKSELDIKNSRLGGQIEEKNTILKQTKSQESQFQRLLAQAKAANTQANNEIVAIEKNIRAKLAAKNAAIADEKKRKEDAARLQAIQSKAQQASNASNTATSFSGLSWPVSSRKINAYFRDPSYPYRSQFEHTAIDIGSTPQGTPVRAAGAGYVARVRDAGQGYSFIMIIHGNGISTVYGHMSALYAQQDGYVAKGDIIGLSGGAPGTRGAGPFTTGPHLHFEVRKDGIPVNPLDFLP